MLKPLEPSEESNAEFVVCDIENTPDGGVIDIDTCWRDENREIEHILFENWADWWGWLKLNARKDPKFRTIYAHNGGGWDWLSLAQALLTELKNERDSVTAVLAGSSMVVLSVRLPGRFTIKFVDSLQLLRSKLDVLATQFLGSGKVDTSDLLPHELKQTDLYRYYRYVQRDTESLLQVLEKGLKIVREHVARIDNFGTTIGATALKVFRTVGIENPITIPWKDDLKDLLREAYNGGRVECFKPGVYKDVNVYDINSLYPSVMRNFPVPVSDRGEWTTNFDNQQCGVFRVSISQYRTDIPPVMLCGGVGKYEVEGAYFTPELNLLKEIDPDAKIEIHNGFVFFDIDYIFRNYVDRLYQLRLDNPDTPLSLLCKFLLNSLYGKFGQNPIREQLISVEDYDKLFELVEDGAEVKPINDDLCVYSIEQQTTCNFEHVGIAGMITSYARVSLYRGLMEAGNNLIYCDTDSVHTTNTLRDSFVGRELGLFKKEFTGEGAYAGKKLYALRNGEKEKIRAKGVSVGGRNGHRLNFNDICEIVAGKTIQCKFQRPATPKQVFAGKESCKFTDKQRKIKRTA